MEGSKWRDRTASNPFTYRGSGRPGPTPPDTLIPHSRSWNPSQPHKPDTKDAGDGPSALPLGRPSRGRRIQRNKKPYTGRCSQWRCLQERELGTKPQVSFCNGGTADSTGRFPGGTLHGRYKWFMKRQSTEGARVRTGRWTKCQHLNVRSSPAVLKRVWIKADRERPSDNFK